MTAKRLRGSNTLSQAQLSTKVKKLEYRVRANTPEKKVAFLNDSVNVAHASVHGVFAFQMGEGTGAHQRVGSRIRLFSIECQGETGVPLDIYLVRAKDDKDLPANIDFAGTVAGSFTNPHFLHTYKHISSGNWGSPAELSSLAQYPFKVSQKFSKGLIIEFDGVNGGYTEVTKNPIWLICRNRSPAVATQRFTYNIKLTYTDA